MSANEKVPIALPPEVVEQIWSELRQSDMPHVSEELFNLCVKGEIGPTPQILEAFCQAAMEYPHLASPKDVYSVLNVPRTSVGHAFQRVRIKARSTRR